jgi:cysteine-rich repeat protein
VCGDGILYEGVEACDDGDMDDLDGCRNDCTMPFCGDGVVWDDEEECDDANMIDTDACTDGCVAATCGDGILWEGMENCDDGNLVNTDACPSTCQPAVCGDGFILAGVEECDDGNMIDDDFCSNACVGQGGVFFFGSFVLNQNGFGYCDEFQVFQQQLQQVQNFSYVAIFGSNDPMGVSCNGAAANTICQALGDNLAVSNVACDGRTWNVGNCGNGAEINAQGNGVCQCTSPAYTVRPCINNSNWGGVNTATCNGPTQTIEVVCG